MTQAQSQDNQDKSEIQIRPATADDQAAVSALYREEGVHDETGEGDTGDDVLDLQSGYMQDEGESCFWVAESESAGVIGMVGVKHKGNHAGEMRRLLVRAEHRNHGYGRRLVEEALKFCNDRGYVKVVLQTQVDQKAALSLFERFGFQLNRTRNVAGRDHLEFYMDLYRQPRDETA